MTLEPPRAAAARDRPIAVALLFLRLGAIAFGGPAAHVGLMRHEFVERRRWVSDQRFMDLLGVTNLIPGPNSTEMAIHLGYVRAGWPGLVGAGIAFVLPATGIVAALAWAYVHFGSTPQVEWLLYGVRPVVIAVVIHAIWGLGRATLRTWHTIAVAVAVVPLALLGVNELVLLAGGALVGAALRLGRERLATRPFDRWFGFAVLGWPAAAGATAVTAFSFLGLALAFLKIGAVLYGGGYVLLAFMRGEFVQRLGWLTDRQLLDAIAIGQVTPGPLFTSATFVGYLLGGFAGAAIATAAIFAPSFVFVAAVAPFMGRIRESAVASALLDSVNATALGLMAAVTAQLGRQSLVDPLTAAVAVVALAALIRLRLNAVWPILAGAGVGLLGRLLMGG